MKLGYKIKPRDAKSNPTTAILAAVFVMFLISGLLLLLLAAGAAVRFAYNEIHGNGAPGSTEVTVSIPQGSGVAAIANKLKEAGVIRSAYLFRWYVGQKGAAAKLQYGDFVLQTSAISYDAIIATLSLSLLAKKKV
jgi:UPF0755 protein